MKNIFVLEENFGESSKMLEWQVVLLYGLKTTYFVSMSEYLPKYFYSTKMFLIKKNPKKSFRMEKVRTVNF